MSKYHYMQQNGSGGWAQYYARRWSDNGVAFSSKSEQTVLDWIAAYTPANPKAGM